MLSLFWHCCRVAAAMHNGAKALMQLHSKKFLILFHKIVVPFKFSAFAISQNIFYHECVEIELSKFLEDKQLKFYLIQLQKGFGPNISHAMLKLVDKRKKESLSNGDLKACVVVLLQTIVLSSLLPKVTLLTRILLLSYFLFLFLCFPPASKNFCPNLTFESTKLRRKSLRSIKTSKAPRRLTRNQNMSNWLGVCQHLVFISFWSR